LTVKPSEENDPCTKISSGIVRFSGGQQIRRGSNHGGPRKLRSGYRSSRPLGERDGEALSDEPDGTEEGLPAWSISGSLRRGTSEGNSGGSLHIIQRQQGLCSSCRGVAA